MADDVSVIEQLEETILCAIKDQFNMENVEDPQIESFEMDYLEDKIRIAFSVKIKGQKEEEELKKLAEKYLGLTGKVRSALSGDKYEDYFPILTPRFIHEPMHA